MQKFAQTRSPDPNQLRRRNRPGAHEARQAAEDGAEHEVATRSDDIDDGTDARRGCVFQRDLPLQQHQQLFGRHALLAQHGPFRYIARFGDGDECTPS